MAKPLVALIGRPNVGKSTLFNRFLGDRVAITEDIPGTTRDRLYADVEWAGHPFTIIDTGGLDLDTESGIPAAVRAQALVALDQADILLFLVDASSGLTPVDIEIANILRCTQKPLLLLINKADNIRRELDASEFYQLGFPAVLTISAYHGRGVADALDWIVDHLIPASSEEDTLHSEEIRIAIVGRPNVGKSSLVNRLLNEERVVVSPTPGTTRDAIDTILEQEGRRFRLIDTAGIRRRGRIEAGAEQYSVFRALQALDRADIAVLLLDATEGVADSDLHVASYVQQRTLGLIAVMNKWDLIPRDAAAATEVLRHIRQRFDFAPYTSVLLGSAKTGFHVNHILKEATRIWDQRQQRIPTAQLNAFVHDELQRHQLLRRGRVLKTLYATQVDINPPTFVFFVNDSSLIHFSYRRFVENELRHHFNFSATPLRLIFRGREESPETRSGLTAHNTTSHP